VHLGSMPMSVRAAIDTFQLGRGDMAMLNDPFRGGTHLPDITLVAPVYIDSRRRKPKEQSPISAGHGASLAKRWVNSRNGVHGPDFYVASRAHHADVGGTYAGSMGLCREIYQEGLRIPPVRIMRSGKIEPDVLALLLNNVRTPEEREGDLGAQIAACHTGVERLQEICERYGLGRAKVAARELLDYSEQMMRAFLKRVPSGTYRAEDFLDSDGISPKPVKITVALKFVGGSPGRGLGSERSAVVVDFSGTDPQVEGSINAVEAITYSACFYVFRCLLMEDVPATVGLMRPIRVIAPLGTVVNARPPAAVAGGNVETSQRIVDVLLRALAQAIPDRIPAAASGTMNNLTIGGIDPRTGEPFAYYETLAGGMGARPTKPGVSGVHTHMTNSMNTPAEALEYAYPLRVRKYSLRRGSGGSGKYPGGEGIVREIEVLAGADVTMLADRRMRGPWGLSGGGDGAPGKTSVMRRKGTVETLPGKATVRLIQGERIRIESPGAGGWGKVGLRDR
jgi:N-methylhydantoinase B